MADNPNALAKQLQRPESKDYLDQLDQLSTDPQYNRGVPDDSRKTLQDAIANAKSAYEAKVNQNEWLDVAQTLGRAVAQFGAAQAGTRGGNKADMSQLNMGQPIDYNQRSNRAFQEYNQDLKNVGDTDAINRQQFADTAANKKEEYQRRAGYLDQALKSAREHENLESQETRTDSREKARVASEDRRMEQSDKRAGEREAQANKRMDLGDINKQEGELQKKLQAARSLANTVATDDDLHKKSKDKIAEKYGAISAQAGIDPDVLRQIGEQSKDEGFLGTGIFRGEDKEKKTKLLNDQVIAPIKNMLDAIQARKKELIRGRSGAAQPAEDTAPAPEVSNSPKTVKIQAPDGSVAEVPADKAQKYISKGGKVIQ